MAAENDFKVQIEKLIELQKIDREIFDLQSQKDSFPERIKEMDELLVSKGNGAKEAEENLKNLQVAKNDKETEMGTKEEQIAKHDAQLYQIKNNTEYKALQGEIDSIKADISLIEEDILKLFDEIEAAQAKCEEEKKIFEEEKSKIAAEKAKINSEEKDLDASISGLKTKRQETAGAIEQQILAIYERILQNRGRSAMARIEGDNCQECHLHLRPQIINDAKIRRNIVLCENCGRILYVTEEA